MKKQLLTYFKWGNLTYLTLLVTDLIFELFQVTKSGTVVTLFGIRMISDITPNQLITTFYLDKRLILSYTILISCFLAIGAISYLQQSKKAN